jgi:hypothetical protein
MFCSSCGKELVGQSGFCGNCGAAVKQDSPPSWRDNRELAEKLSKPSAVRAWGCLVVVIAVLALIGTCIVAVGGLTGTPELSDAEIANKAAEERKGFHCLSPWDGNHDGLEILIKAQLKDPDSMETIETLITPVDASGNHTIGLKYRARNGFGGMAVGQAFGSVDNKTCKATLISMD